MPFKRTRSASVATDIAQQATADNPEGSTLPLGAASQLEEAFDTATSVEEDEFGEELDEEGGFDVADEAADFAQPTGKDALLFGPTNRPLEPVTAGAPFGPGATSSLRLDDDALVRRFVDEMAARRDAPEEIKSFARRVARGE